MSQNDYIINISLLEKYKSDFSSEKQYFNSTSYNTFNSGYINRCSDNYVIRMKNKLRSLYTKVTNDYNSINLWFNDYVNDIKNLENVLSGNGNSGSIKHSSLRNYINSNLPALNGYTISFANALSLNFESAFGDYYTTWKYTSEAKNNTLSFINKIEEIASPYLGENIVIFDKAESIVSSVFDATTDFLGKAEQRTKAIATSWFQKSEGSNKKEEKITADTLAEQLKNGEITHIEYAVKMAEITIQQVSSTVEDGWNDFTAGVEEGYNQAVEKVEEIGESIEEGWNDFTTAVENGYNNVVGKVEEFGESAEEWYHEEFVPFAESAAATGATVATSVGEGLAKAGEWFIDGLAMMGNAMSAQNMSNAWAFSSSQLQTYQNTIEFNNEATKAFVETDYVTPVFDQYYEETEAGQWQKENAIYFEETREVGKGLGQTVGTIALSIGGSPVASAAVIGMGKGSEQAYQSGADFHEGFATGFATALWEGTQWYIGMGINKWIPIKGSGSGSKVLNSAIRVLADGIDGAVEGFAQPLINSIYQEGTYSELFEAAGGWTNVGIQGLIGAGGSLIGEIFDLGKYFRNEAKLGKLPATMEVSSGKTFSTQELLDIIKDEDKLTKFLDFDSNKNMFDGTKTEYSSAMKQLLETADKNTIDLGISKNQIQKINNFIDSFTTNIKNVNTINLSDLKYKPAGFVSSISARLESNIRKYVYTDTNAIEGLNKKIMDNGLYHFTDAADQILDSGYIKATDEALIGPLGYLGSSYGNPKSFFFSGIPEVGNFATNLDSVPLKTTAVKVQPNIDIVNSSKLKVRNLDDGAITYDGRFDLSGSQASKEYLCLVRENDELVYKPVSKEFYDNYENTAEGQALAEFLKDKKNVQAIKDDYLVGLSAKSTNAKVSSGSSLVTNSTSFSNVKNVLDKIMSKIGNGTGRSNLLLYAANGNIERIPVEFRDQIKNITATDIKNYFDIEDTKIGTQFFGGSPIKNSIDISATNQRNPLITNFKAAMDAFAGSQESCLNKLKKLFKSSADKAELKNLEMTVKKYYPDMTKQEMEAFFTRLNEHGCTYVAAANSIFEQLKYDADLFYKEFGFDMYLPNGELNHDQLILDVFSSLSKMGEVNCKIFSEPVSYNSWSETARNLLGIDPTTIDNPHGFSLESISMLKVNDYVKENGLILTQNDSGNITIKKLNETTTIVGTPNDVAKKLLGKDLEIETEAELLKVLKDNNIEANFTTKIDASYDGAKILASDKWMNAYFESKGINMKFESSKLFGDSLDGDDLLSKVTNLYNDGYSVEVTARAHHPTWMTDGTKLGGTTLGVDGVGHAMVLRGITDNNEVIVSSWGKLYKIPSKYLNSLEFNAIKIGVGDNSLKEALNYSTSNVNVNSILDSISAKKETFVSKVQNLFNGFSKNNISKLPETIEVSVGSNGKLFSVEQLIDIIQDEKKWSEKFAVINANEIESIEEFTLAAKQLLELVDKNKIDLGISDARLKQMKRDIKGILDFAELVKEQRIEDIYLENLKKLIPECKTFSKDYLEAVRQLSEYYGDAGDKVAGLFSQLMTIPQIFDELSVEEKAVFKTFLQETRQGQHLSKLTDEEIKSLTLYTNAYGEKINFMLNIEKIFGYIEDMPVQTVIDNIDAAIVKYGGLEEATELYSGAKISSFIGKNNEYADLFDGIDTNNLSEVYRVLKNHIGKPLGNLGYISTSPSYSHSFAKLPECPIVLKIMAPQGTQGAYINQVSACYNEECEFLLARNPNLKMVDVSEPTIDVNGLKKIIITCIVEGE